MEVYNKNRDKNQGMHDEIREQNAKLKDAPLKDKIAYYKEYYLKATLAILAAAIFIGYIAYTMITAPDDTAFAAYFFNNTGDSSSTELLDSFVDYAGIDTKKHNAYIDASMHYGDAADNMTGYSYVDLEKSMAVIAAKELDVLVGDQSAFDYYCKSEVFSDITTVLPDDLMEQFKDKLYYYTNEETNETLPFGIDVSDAPKLQEYHYYDGITAYFGFIVNSDSVDNAIAFLRYIYEE